MQLCILSFHITHVTCISPVIEHLGKMSLEGIHQSLIGGRGCNALAALPQAITAFLLVFGMLKAHEREKPMRQSISSPGPHMHTRSHESRGKTWRKTQCQGKSFWRAWNNLGVYLGSTGPFSILSTQVPHSHARTGSRSPC